ncbi:MAG: phytoene desaturase family protein, partial [Pirellulales bacterium]
MVSPGKYDAIVIGGGHNGLVTAAYLARAKRRVLVLERRHVLGGCATTEELWPGYRVSTAAYVISLLLPEISRDLRLGDYGLRVLPRSPSSFTPLPDGRSLTMGPDAALNRREIAKFSARDAEAFPRYEALLERVARTLEPTLSQPAPDLLPLPNAWRRRGWRKKLRDAKLGYGLYQALSKLGAEMPAAIELLVGPARTILDRWFEAEALKATLATDAIIGAFAAPSTPGSAYVLLHHVMGEAGGARGVWGYVQGGMGSLATALAAAGRDLGVEVRREAEVARIVVDRGRVRGVELIDGTVFEAPSVASSIDPRWTFEHFIQAEQLPADFLAAVERIDYQSASMKINVALSEPPNFTCLPSSGVMPHHRGTMHIGPTVDYIERGYDEALAGRPSSEPVLELTMATSVDDTLAP